MTGNYKKVKDLINEADAVLIGASNGLSIADGYNIFTNNAWFRSNFGDFQSRYGISNVLQGAFFPFPTPEERWGFVSRLASRVYFDVAPGRTMRNLRDVLAKKDTFVLTTNADNAFQHAGFDPAQVFAMEGGLGEMRCTARCTNEVRKDPEALERMAAAEKDGRVPAGVIPRCERCGQLMEPNLMEDDSFFTTSYWQSQAAAFSDFVKEHAGERIAILEIGVGPRNGLLLQPLRTLAANEPDASYVILNLDTAQVPPVLADKTITLPDDVGTSLEALKAA